MKKQIVVLFMGLLLCPVTSCGKENIEKQTEAVYEAALAYKFEDYMEPIAFHYSIFRVVSEGTSRIFDAGDFFITYVKDEKTSDLKDVLSKLEEKFFDASYYHLRATDYVTSVKNSESIVVNDIEIIRTEGEIVGTYDDGTKETHFMRAYTFIYGETMFGMIGVTEDAYDDMTANIDAMINTLRVIE